MKFSLVLAILLSSHAWAKWSVTAFNIRNFDKDPGAGTTDLVELTKIIKASQSDVMAFEEVVNVKAFQALVKNALPGYLFETSACGGMGKQHLAVAYNPKTFTLVSKSEDATFSGSTTGGCGSLRPVFLVNLQNKATKQLHVFGTIHLKAGGDARAFSQRWSQYTKLTELAKKHSAQNLILLGDFNTTGYNLKNEDYVRFENFLNDSSLRTTSENLACTSYWEGTLGGEEHQSSILDHIVIQDKNAAAVQEIKLGSHCAKSACKPATPAELGQSYLKVSDHCPIQVTFK